MRVCVFNGCVHVHVCECLCQHVCNFGQDMEGVSEYGGVERLAEKRDEAVGATLSLGCAKRQQPLAQQVCVCMCVYK